jgi:hypothetical protein
MNGPEVEHEFDGIRLDLLRHDPDFGRRWRAVERGSTLNAIAVFALLAASAVLLATGFAIQSLAVWCAGALASLASFVVDLRYRRRLRSPHPRPQL